MDHATMKAELARRRAERIERANQVREIALGLTDEQIEYLVPEDELVKKLPAFPHTRDGKKLTEKQLDRLIEIIHRQVAAEKVLDAEKA